MSACVFPTCSETGLLLSVTEVTVGVVLQPPLFFPLLGGDAGLGDAPCTHRLHAPVLPFNHVSDATLGHGCGLGHSLLHGAGHTWWWKRHGGEEGGREDEVREEKGWEERGRSKR